MVRKEMFSKVVAHSSGSRNRHIARGKELLSLKKKQRDAVAQFYVNTKGLMKVEIFALPLKGRRNSPWMI